MSEESTPYQIVTHGEILHAIRELERNVRTNGCKIDILIDHLGADFSREDATARAGIEAVIDAEQNLPPHEQQPPKG